ncbi:MAG: SpoIIE family protein phosphatase [Clostridia bacterium]|nr:SpoIIE family protein phosphatase [Clostridia bacterium]
MKKKSIFTGLSFNLGITMAITVLIFALAVGTVGYLGFTDTLTQEYNTSAINIAKSAIRLFVDADHVKDYLYYSTAINAYADIGEAESQAVINGTAENLSDEERVKYQALTPERREYVAALCAEYAKCRAGLIALANDMSVNIIYIVSPDVDNDFKTLSSVINAPGEKSGYKPWAVGYKQKTGEDYIEIYRSISDGNYIETNVVRDKNLGGAVPHTTSIVPVLDSDGGVVAVTCVQTAMSDMAKGRTRYVVFVALTMVFLAAASLAILIAITRHQVIKPLQKVTVEAERFARENSAPTDPLSDDISRVNEIATLASSIGAMETETLKYIENLSEAISEKQRIGAELGIATIIQKSSIPTDFGTVTARGIVDLFGVMRAAKQVGGDYYDFFIIDYDHLSLVIADVSGKGIPAALFMMVTKIILKEITLTGGEPSQIINFVNERICSNNMAEMFVTIWFGILELSTGKVTAVNAGHDYPAIMRSGGDFEIVKTVHGIAVGAMSGIRYRQYEFTLGRGDKLFLYTDGFPEATADGGKMLTMDGMLDILNEDKELSPAETIENLLSRVEVFTGDAPQFDDMTALCIEYKGVNSKMKIKMPATDENLDKATEFITDCLSEKGVGMKTVNQMTLAAEELFVNVAHYAYAPDVGEVEITVQVDGDKLMMKFIDGGRPFNPLEKKDPDVTLAAEDRAIGGLGVFMVKRLVDNIYYEYVDGKNILTLEKLL